MTEEVSANSGEQVENTDTNENVTSATDAGVTEAAVETENDSAKENEGTANDEVEALRKELEATLGKLDTIRTTADKNAAAIKKTAAEKDSLASENLRLKAALEHGFNKADLELITATDEAGINRQIELIKARDARLANSSAGQYITLAGENSNTTATPSALERKINEQFAQLANLNQKGF